MNDSILRLMQDAALNIRAFTEPNMQVHAWCQSSLFVPEGPWAEVREALWHISIQSGQWRASSGFTSLGDACDQVISAYNAKMDKHEQEVAERFQEEFSGGTR